jgi:hypothetical protein
MPTATKPLSCRADLHLHLLVNFCSSSSPPSAASQPSRQFSVGSQRCPFGKPHFRGPRHEPLHPLWRYKPRALGYKACYLQNRRHGPRYWTTCRTHRHTACASPAHGCGFKSRAAMNGAQMEKPQGHDCPPRRDRLTALAELRLQRDAGLAVATAAQTRAVQLRLWRGHRVPGFLRTLDFRHRTA